MSLYLRLQTQFPEVSEWNDHFKMASDQWKSDWKNFEEKMFNFVVITAHVSVNTIYPANTKRHKYYVKTTFWRNNYVFITLCVCWIAPTGASQIAKTLGSTSIKHRPDTFASDRYLIDVDPTVVAIWVETRVPFMHETRIWRVHITMSLRQMNWIDYLSPIFLIWSNKPSTYHNLLSKNSSSACLCIQLLFHCLLVSNKDGDSNTWGLHFCE